MYINNKGKCKTMNSQYKKKGIATIYLAKQLLSLKKGDRLGTISFYTEKSDFSRGTIQNALKEIKNEGAIFVKAKGHLGTVILDIDYKRLWSLAGFDILAGAMPLPYSKIYEGLATGLNLIVQDYGIDMKMAYINGSLNRLDMLKKKKYDFIITSLLTAKAAIKLGFNIDICMSFGKQSYLSEHVLILSDDSFDDIKDGMKIGLDPNSIDMKIITEEICKGKKVQFVYMPYNQIAEQVKEHKIDAAIWNYDEIKEKGINVKVKHIMKAQTILDSSVAVIVVNKDEPGNVHFLNEIIDKNNVVSIMKKVEKREIMPAY